ncbi:MAG: hypothetical protein Q7S33_03480 [Nanoarchaeota archaeon]|nr:hypothetical protein [Nanoarchaeota archaeon]
MGREEIEEEELLRQTNISLVLDSYQDLFSDFDPRVYSERAISDDFLTEIKRAIKDKPDSSFELRLLISAVKRNLRDEIKIKTRLKEHFQAHFREKEKEMKKMKRQGIFWIIIGAILMGTVTFLRTYTEPNLWMNMAIVITEPAGWFGFWEGLGKIFLDSKEKEPELISYKKMAKAKISFNDY